MSIKSAGDSKARQSLLQIFDANVGDLSAGEGLATCAESLSVARF